MADAATAGSASGVGVESVTKSVPRAKFLENVEEFVRSEKTVEQALTVLTNVLSKYRTVERNLAQRRANLKVKIPEIQKTLETVEFLLAKKEASEKVETRFELNAGVYVNAEIAEPKTVSLWLGANVMVEYTLEEAAALLRSNLQQATEYMQLLDSDLAYVRDQVNTTEVSVARVYNWDVKQRKAAGQAAKS